jgi:hypothetical protein
MAQKSEATGFEALNVSTLPIFQLGKHQTEAMLNMQKEVMAVCEEANRNWIERVKSEVELWSELASKLSASKSVPDGVGAYQDTVAQRMKLAAEDGQRLFDESQKIIGAMTRSLSNGWPQQGGTT